MPTIEDLGRKVKVKHSKYQHLSDEEAGRRVRADYPGSYLEYTDPETSLQKVDSNTTLQHSFDVALQELTNFPQGIEPKLQEHIDTLQDFYRPSRGVFTSWWQRRKSEGRTKMADQITAEELALINQINLLGEKYREKQINDIQFRTFIAQNVTALLQLKAQITLLEKSTSEGLSPTAFDLVQTERAISGIRISEHDQKTKIDLDRVIEEQRETIRLSYLSKAMSEHQQLVLVQELMDTIYQQMAEIEQGTMPDAYKARMIADREAILVTLKEDRSAKAARLLQNNNR